MSFICKHMQFICKHMPSICKHIPPICKHMPLICKHIYAICKHIAAICKHMPNICKHIPANVNIFQWFVIIYNTLVTHKSDNSPRKGSQRLQQHDDLCQIQLFCTKWLFIFL